MLFDAKVTKRPEISVVLTQVRMCVPKTAHQGAAFAMYYLKAWLALNDMANLRNIANVFDALA